MMADQIPSRFKSVTNRSGKNYVTTETSILYSRQKFAERLRLAWKHREENKANIDIFLAHGHTEECYNSELSISVPPISPSTEQSDFIQNNVSWDMEVSNSEIREKKICEINNRNKKECEKILEIASQMVEESKDVMSNLGNEEEKQNKVRI
jgi:hypothetical protein